MLRRQELEHSADADAVASDVELVADDEAEIKDEVDDDEAVPQPVVSAAAEILVHDPFKDDERDPGETNALSSSLWELIALQRHYVPEVADLAVLFARDMQRPLFDIAQSASQSAKSLLDKMRRKKAKHGVPLEHRLRESVVSAELAAFYCE